MKNKQKRVTQKGKRQTRAMLRNKEHLHLPGSVTARLAHEIRNPLAIISSTAQFLRSAFPENVEVTSGMETILRSVNQVNSAMGELSNFYEK